MPTSIPLGVDVRCMLESAQVTQLQPATHDAIPKDRLAADLRAALSQPLNFPPLASATVPGDRAVVAVEYGVPRCCQLLAGALAALRDAGVESSRISLVLSNEFAQDQQLCKAINELATAEDVEVVVFDPDGEQSTALLGVTRAGRPLRLCRELCDADLVMSIGLCKLSSSAEQTNPSYSGLFPVFSDRETLERYQAPIAADSKVIHAERMNEIEEAGWLLGAGFTIQVVPNPSGEVAAVIAGDPASVAKQASERYREIWSRAIDSSGDLIIATITGDASQQTWQNIGRVIELTEHALDVGGVLVLWTDLSELPGASLSRLASNDDVETIERELMRDRLSDSWPAMLLCRALQRGAVFFHSQLASEIVESLGMASLTDVDELARLSRNRRHCIVLEDAQMLLPVINVVAQ